MNGAVPGAAFLDGIRVLDLTTFLSGPFGTQLLSDMGADVIKVESRAGDSSRTIPPHFAGGDSAYFHAVNRNKTSIQIDLKKQRGVELFLSITQEADVVIENFRPGVMDRLGLGVEALREANPALVTCSISGFGSTGPRRLDPAYDAVVQALSGGMSLTGHPGDPPVRMGIPIGDLAAGMYASLGVLGALVRRAKSGEGEHIDVAMLDSQLALLVYQASYYLHSGVVPGPQGAGHLSIPTYRSFLCRDGLWLMVTANTERMWRGLCEVLEVQYLVDDARFETNAMRLDNATALWAVLEPAFAAKPARVLLEALTAAEVPAAPVNTVAEALGDAQAAARDMVVRLPTAEGEIIRVVGNPIKSPGMRPDRDFRCASSLGSDSHSLVGRLAGLVPAKVRDLQAHGVIGPFSA